ncbi:hypothetical protein JET76_15515 [Pseudomonas putida]|uniref:hypothetical protein n=1 Tax=Pseudomonas putida TaxID=303 RepID=UPI0018E6C06D|nr:hypothetical protein [Pseudomonas putida]MBI6942761.1 hypothetical protein [Pseudomonas putida]MBI6958808.1 hypothetical protein [Pseudomonas putida]
MASTSRCKHKVGGLVLYWRLLIARNIKKALEHNHLNALLIPQQPAPDTVANQTPALPAVHEQTPECFQNHDKTMMA